VEFDIKKASYSKLYFTIIKIKLKLNQNLSY